MICPDCQTDSVIIADWPPAFAPICQKCKRVFTGEVNRAHYVDKKAFEIAIAKKRKYQQDLGTYNAALVKRILAER
jgi:hypothetical protein